MTMTDILNPRKRGKKDYGPLVADYKAGMPFDALAAKHGYRSAMTVRGAISDLGVADRSPRLTDRRRRAVVRAYEKGDPVPDIARRFKVTTQAVYYTLKRAGKAPNRA